MKTTATHRNPAVARALLLGLATFGLGTSAQAATDSVQAEGVTRVVVKYGDLNLANPEGARTLYARLRAAADQACNDTISGRDLQSVLWYQTCYSNALDRAVSQVGSARLQALHRKAAAGSSVG